MGFWESGKRRYDKQVTKRESASPSTPKIDEKMNYIAEKPSNRIVLGALIIPSLWMGLSCSKARFSGSNPGRGEESAPTATPENPQIPGEKPPENPAPESPNPATPPPAQEGPAGNPPVPSPPPAQPPGGGTDVTKEVPQCVPTEKLTGTRMVMVIDNSNSNAETDCPGAVQNGVFRETKRYTCTQETSRSKAALAVFDLLKGVGEKDSANPLSKSQLAVTYFPTQEDYVSGFKVEAGFTETTSANRALFANTLSFTKSPFGLTPYVAAMSSAEKAFEGAPQDGRSKVVFFVTDGEATDRDPSAAIKKAEALMGSGVQFFTIYYPTKESKAARIAKHTTMMREIDQNYVAAGGGHWYDETRYKSFDEYIQTIVGTSPGVVTDRPQASTLMRISSKVDGACADGATLCERKSYEVADANALAQAMQQIVKREVLGCDPK